MQTLKQEWKVGGRPGTEGYQQAYDTLLEAIEKDFVDGLQMHPQTKAEAFCLIRNFISAEAAALFNGRLETKFTGGTLYLHLRLGNADIIEPIPEKGETSIASIKETLGQASDIASKMSSPKFSLEGLSEAYHRAARIQRGITYTKMTQQQLHSYFNSDSSYSSNTTRSTLTSTATLPSPTPTNQKDTEFAQEMADKIKKGRTVSEMLNYLKSKDFKDKKHLLPPNCLTIPEFIKIWGPVYVTQDMGDIDSQGRPMTIKEALEKTWS